MRFYREQRRFSSGKAKNDRIDSEKIARLLHDAKRFWKSSLPKGVRTREEAAMKG
jgi:hypothetical protein